MTEKIASKGTFVRDATGLVRGVSFLGAFAATSANLSVITGWYLFQYLGQAVPGGEFGIAVTASALVVIFPAMIYAMMGAAFPRSGGEYVWISRTLFPELGFMVNFYYAISGMMILGFIVTVIVVPNVSAVLAVYGIIYNNSMLLDWVTALANINNATILGVILLPLLSLPVFLRTQTWTRIMNVLLVLCTLSLLLMFGAMWSTNATDFANALNSFTATPNLYQTVIDNASKSGLMSNWTMGVTLGPALLFGILAVNGWATPAYFAGEVKRAQKSVPLAIILGLVINAALYVVLFEGSYHAFGYAFSNAIGFAGANPTNIPLTHPLFVSMLFKDNPVLVFLVNLGILLGGPWMILMFYVVLTRCLFAWSFDRIIPEKFSLVSERFNTPVYTTITAMILAVFFLLLYNYTSYGAYLANITLGIIINTAIAMVAAALFPWRRKEFFDASPSFTRRKIGGLPLITIIATIGFCLLFYVIFAGVTNPAIFGPISYQSLGFMVGIYVAGLVVYYIALFYRKARGVDIRLAFKEVPPE